MLANPGAAMPWLPEPVAAWPGIALPSRPRIAGTSTGAAMSMIAPPYVALLPIPAARLWTAIPLPNCKKEP